MIITDKDGDTIEVRRGGTVTRIEVEANMYGAAVDLNRVQTQQLRDELNRILEASEPGQRAYQVFCTNAKDGVRRATWSQLPEHAKGTWAAVEAEDYSRE